MQYGELPKEEAQPLVTKYKEEARKLLPPSEKRANRRNNRNKRNRQNRNRGQGYGETLPGGGWTSIRGSWAIMEGGRGTGAKFGGSWALLGELDLNLGSWALLGGGRPQFGGPGSSWRSWTSIWGSWAIMGEG